MTSLTIPTLYQDIQAYDPPHINVGHVQVGTEALGPGWRSVVWVQGCPFRCPGCISPEWQSFETNRIMPVDELASHLLCDSAITGITISGGEPMMQAAGLTALLKAVRRQRELDVICYTGFSLEDLRDQPEDTGVQGFLEEIDVLIDGPYLQDQNDNKGLRGSSNQHIHFFSEKLAGIDFIHAPRRQEVMITDQAVVFVGVPTIEGQHAMNNIIKQCRNGDFDSP